MKGQAFVVFRDINQASTAKHALNKYDFMGRQIVKIFLNIRK